MILLTNRAIVKLSGADARKFLQGMITNNIDKLTPEAPLYTAMLTPQGKYLFDFILYDIGEAILLDIDAGRVAELVKKLSMYKLRSAVEIAVEPEMKVYSTENEGYPDPRSDKLGRRLITAKDQPQTGSFTDYETKRINARVADSNDFIADKTFIMQNGFERMNGVDFNKGCYIGQEVTARTKYKGGVKKDIYRVEAVNLPAAGAEIKANSKVIGEMRSSVGNIGLAQLDIEAAESGAALSYEGGALKIA